MDPAEDPVYQNSVKPFTWICAVILPSAYLIGLMFSLHTHADMVWEGKTSSKTDHDVIIERAYPVHIIHPNQAPNEQTPIIAQRKSFKLCFMALF
jgi:Ca2+:H+ antiporter